MSKAIDFRFDSHKAIQAAGVLAQCDPSKSMISRMRLLKLLYIADREALKEIGRPITGDRLVAMKKGPVLSRFYDMIKGPKGELDEFFESTGYHLKLIKSPDDGDLNRYEIKKLKEVSDRYKDLDDEELSELTHAFPEWKKHDPGGSSETISVEDVLDALGASDQIEYVRQNANMDLAVAELWHK